ncbi:MAG: diguanylate cyclase [Sporichthyaceae bacterium]|nr:diguanylate cyclase [Sporichthyaceae bacterium]
MKVLVADDDLGSRLLAQAAVEALGHDCVSAADGTEAWSMFHELRPDVLITDREMPGLDGVSLCRQIRERQQDQYTYVVLLTSHGDAQDVLSGMRAGADDYVTKPLNPLDLEARLLAAQRVTALHAELASVRKQLREQARTDPLTGLRNRLGLTDELDLLHQVSDRYHRSYCLAMCDIDFFKRYNDTYGHVAGDRALRAVSAAIVGALRAADRVYRYGGEEFLVLLAEQTLPEGVVVMERVRRAVMDLALEHRANGDTGVLTVSTGVAACGVDRRSSSEQLIAEADEALYEAKASGRNQVRAARAGRREVMVGDEN